MVTKGFWKRDSNQTPWSKIPRSKPKVPNLAWLSQVSQTKLPTKSVSIPPSRTPPSVTARRRPRAPGGAGASGWLGGGAESAGSTKSAGTSAALLAPAASIPAASTFSPRSAACRTGVTSPSTQQAASAAESLLVVALAGLVVAGLAMPAAARFLPVALLASPTVLVRFPRSLVGSVRRLGALPAGGFTVIRLIPGTSRLGCGGLAARRRRGQRRGARTFRCRDPRAGLGILYGEAEDNPD
jgi:hypothetical protein